MKNRTIRTCLAAIICSLLFGQMSVAQEPPMPFPGPVRLNVPVESPGIPAYVRLEAIGDGGIIAPSNAQWTPLVFYRAPNCIPEDFNLLLFLDFPGPEGPGAFACPSLVEGFDLRLQSLDPTMPPDYMLMRNMTPEFPIWFVATKELNALLDRGFVYIDEIDALPSRIAARAWQFEEQLYPAGSNDRPGLTMSARGRLETGGRFAFFWHNHPASDENVFELDIDVNRPGPGNACDPSRLFWAPRVCR